MMTDDRNVNLSQDESQTYLHLGIIAAHTGYGASIFATRQQIANGDRDPSNDLLAWFAQQGFSDEELAELYDFRNSLFHGVVIVQSALLNEWEVVLSWRHEAKTASLQSSSQERRQHQEIPVSDT